MAAAADYGRVRTLLALFATALVAQPALTAGNGVPAAPGGIGAGAISGYAVSNVSYSLDGGTIDRVSFELAPATAGSVRVRLAAGEPWSNCAVADGAASCPVSTPVGAAARLEVVASS